MKKTVRVLALVLTLALVGALFVACGKTLSGTYRTDEILGTYSELIFKGSKVTMNTYAVGALASSAEYSYELKDSSIVLTAEGASSELAFSQDGDTVTVGILTYTKQK